MSSSPTLARDSLEVEPAAAGVRSGHPGGDARDAALAAAAAAFAPLPREGGGPAAASLACRGEAAAAARDADATVRDPVAAAAAAVGLPRLPGVITVDSRASGRREAQLLLTFVLLVIAGTGNKVFQKLQAIPMYNYPNSLNLLQK